MDCLYKTRCNPVSISKYKITFSKVYVLNWGEEVFVFKKVKITVPWSYVMEDRNDEETCLNVL